jgi:hypothetical protein
MNHIIKLNKPVSCEVKNEVTSPSFTSPLIFNRKKNKAIYKPLQYVINDTGITRHYPPAAQE